MNWEFISVIAEVVSAIAVVVTLMFLAIEVRNNRRATEAASVDAQSSGINDLNSLLVSDPEFAKVWNVGMADPEKLDEIDRLRLAFQIQNYVNLYIALRRHRKTGALPVENWDYYARGFGVVMNTPGARALVKEIAIPADVAKEFAEYQDAPNSYAFLPAATRSQSDAPNKSLETNA